MEVTVKSIEQTISIWILEFNIGTIQNLYQLRLLYSGKTEESGMFVLVKASIRDKGKVIPVLFFN
jgi:hypothetical protein